MNGNISPDKIEELIEEAMKINELLAKEKVSFSTLATFSNVLQQFARNNLGNKNENSKAAFIFWKKLINSGFTEFGSMKNDSEKLQDVLLININGDCERFKGKSVHEVAYIMAWSVKMAKSYKIYNVKHFQQDGKKQEQKKNNSNSSKKVVYKDKGDGQKNMTAMQEAFEKAGY